MYLITVNIPSAPPLRYKVEKYDLDDNRVVFLDKNGLTKNFPQNLCLIEEVTQ